MDSKQKTNIKCCKFQSVFNNCQSTCMQLVKLKDFVFCFVGPQWILCSFCVCFFIILFHLQCCLMFFFIKRKPVSVSFAVMFRILTEICLYTYLFLSHFLSISNRQLPLARVHVFSVLFFLFA